MRKVNRVAKQLATASLTVLAVTFVAKPGLAAEVAAKPPAPVAWSGTWGASPVFPMDRKSIIRRSASLSASAVVARR